MTKFNVNRWKVQQVGSHGSCTSLYYVPPPRYTKKARWPMLCKFSRWGKKSCNSYINGLWLDQSVKNRLHTRSPSSNRGGKSLTNVYTSSTKACNARCLCWMQSFDIFVASFMRCVSSSHPWEEKSGLVRVSELDLWLGWTSRMSAPNYRTLHYGAHIYTLWYTQQRHTQLWYTLLS